ncbi:RNA polymerase II elongation factor ELL isoform X1 [Rhinichthys klamathensis goyatoka]|uniref:RNA polymerase II elongation factor ELL isoform X1 n=1 Tax=Rhinichthys klamathensis goyatoka TaxID=3034132 RepID=UPI0024B5BED3|nr:RNA polymerase II elongation factor ELL isoform X1 [Rhinichthys klamathensis goyatoka]
MTFGLECRHFTSVPDMAALRQEHRYGLSCGKINKSIPNKTIFHVKLTDTAIRTLEAYQNLKGSLPNQPAICFKGNQGYIKIPASSDSPDAFRVFSFYLSSDSKDKPQASFDCIHQYVSGDGRDHLEGQGSIQDKITVCATDDSYQMTRERMSQVEKDILSRSAIEIKPGSTRQIKCVKIKKKQGLPTSSDNINRHSPSNKRSGAPSLVAHRPLKERVIHILALKPYSKPELLLWLEREKASPKDKADLSAVLDEVAKLNPKDHSFTLKDDFYRHVRRDWPGYVEEERQLIQRVLARKLQPLSSSSSQLKSFQSSHSFHKTSGDSPSQLSPVKNLSMKRPVPSDHLESQTPKKQRLLDQNMPLQSPSNGHLSSSMGRSSSAHGNTSLQRGTNTAQQSPDGLYQRHKLSESNSLPKPEQPEPAQQPPSSPKHTRTEPEIRTDQQLANGQHKKKKSKKHKEKERERLKPAWAETSPDLKQNQENINDHERPNTPVTRASPDELPDYLIKYNTITDSEQRQRYKEDFCAEYDEYRDLHERIGRVTEIFVQLGSKIKTLSPGTQEYKVMEDQIMEKYRKYKKKFPGYREEKKRCEYLHQKLSHIKGLILDYDRTQALS